MSDKTCTTCHWFNPERRDPDAGWCSRYPRDVYQDKGNRYVCGEWVESKVTDEHTFLAGGVPAFKVTERENGTSTTEPVPDETHDEFDRSRWYELFGTPERAARTLEKFELDHLDWCYGTDHCEKCPYEFGRYDRYDCYLPDGFSLLEWLRGDAE